MKILGNILAEDDATNKRYVDGELAKKASLIHTHDDRYYTEGETDNKLNAKANTSHTHTKSQITDFPTDIPADGGHSDTTTQLKSIETNRGTNENPNWYIINYQRGIITEFKDTTIIGLRDAFSWITQYCLLTTYVPWGDESGGMPVQVATCNSGIFYRISVNVTTWNSWRNIDETSVANSDTIGGLLLGYSWSSNATVRDCDTTRGVELNTYNRGFVDTKLGVRYFSQSSVFNGGNAYWVCFYDKMANNRYMLIWGTTGSIADAYSYTWNFSSDLTGLSPSSISLTFTELGSAGGDQYANGVRITALSTTSCTIKNSTNGTNKFTFTGMARY